MPTFEVSVQGKSYRVEIPDPGASPLQVIVDGQPFEVVIGDVSASESPLRPKAPPPAAEPSPLPPPPSLTIARPVTPAGANGGAEVTSPMPGTILSVVVGLGQTVEVGQVLCILEAMKMKNPIRASVAGQVAEILVQAGQTVPYGALLLKLA